MHLQIETAVVNASVHVFVLQLWLKSWSFQTHVQGTILYMLYIIYNMEVVVVGHKYIMLMVYVSVQWVNVYEELRGSCGKKEGYR